MQLIALPVALLALVPGLAFAACDIGISTPGSLALSGDSTVLTSEAGVASVLAITNITGFLNITVTLSNPRLDTYPAGFAAGSAVVEQNYSAAWVLGSSSNPAFTSGSRSFNVPIGLLVTITLNNRVTAPGGFRQGGYTTKTTVTCS